MAAFVYDVDDIIQSIEEHVNRHGGKNSDWCIGITNDSERLKEEHNNLEYWWLWGTELENAIREIETHFINKGYQRATGGEEEDGCCVYVFRPIR